LALEPGARLTCPTRPFRNPRSRTGQVGDLPREHCGPLSLGQIPTCHEDHSAGEHVDPIGRNCVAIRAATFGKCPSHFATRWAGYFSTQSVAYDARRLSRSRGHRGCRSWLSEESAAKPDSIVGKAVFKPWRCRGADPSSRTVSACRMEFQRLHYAAVLGVAESLSGRKSSGASGWLDMACRRTW